MLDMPILLGLWFLIAAGTTGIIDVSRRRRFGSTMSLIRDRVVLSSVLSTEEMIEKIRTTVVKGLHEAGTKLPEEKVSEIVETQLMGILGESLGDSPGTAPVRLLRSLLPYVICPAISMGIAILFVSWLGREGFSPDMSLLLPSLSIPFTSGWATALYVDVFEPKIPSPYYGPYHDIGVY